MSETTPTTDTGTHWRTGFPSKFLHAEDLQGRAVIVTIAGWAHEQLQVPSKNQTKLGTVISLVGKQKALVANKTNCASIAEALGTDIMDNWVGRRIVIYPTTTTLGKKKGVPCIRVKPAPAGAPATPAKPAQPAADDLHAQAAALDKEG